jgi:hypothetical protein
MVRLIGITFRDARERSVLISSRSGDSRATSEIASAGFKGKTSLLDDDLAAMMSLLNPLSCTQ